jgi:hypothetical protein
MSLAQTIDRGFQLALLVQQVKKIVPAFRNHPFRGPTSGDPPTEKKIEVTRLRVYDLCAADRASP